LGLELALVGLGEPATEDRRDFIGPADGAIGIEQAFAEVIQGGSALEDQVVAVFDLAEEQAVFTAGMFTLSAGKEGCQASAQEPQWMLSVDLVQARNLECAPSRGCRQIMHSFNQATLRQNKQSAEPRERCWCDP